MSQIRRTAAFLTGLVLAGMSCLLAVPAVHAATVAPPGGSQGGPVTVAGSGAGTAGWEIATIALAAVLVLMLVIAGSVTLRLRSRVRPAVQ